MLLNARTGGPFKKGRDWQRHENEQSRIAPAGRCGFGLPVPRSADPGVRFHESLGERQVALAKAMTAGQDFVGDVGSTSPKTLGKPCRIVHGHDRVHGARGDENGLAGKAFSPLRFLFLLAEG